MIIDGTMGGVGGGMFGYVTPLKSELRMREMTQYQAWYCGLCQVLRRKYGQLPRLVLDYDCAFLALLLAGVMGEGAPCEMRRCGYKPLQKPRPIAPPCGALEYAADINVLLFYYKLRDDWQDERNIAALLGAKALGRAAKRAGKCQPVAATTVRQCLDALSDMERKEDCGIDAVADAFAGMLRDVLAGYAPLDDRQREALSWLGYHLGRWIYMMDAWEDREKDKKNGAYNPFVHNDVTKEHASFLLYASLSEVEKAYDLLTVYSNRGILDNILYQGLRNTCRAKLEGDNG